MKIKLLLIEEDQDTLEIFTYVLEEDGFEVLSSRNSNILRKVTALKPDVILLNDWLREKQTGSDHCELLKADPATSEIPVILISTFLSIKDVFNKVGASGYIYKPFDIDELKPTIDAVMGLHRQSA